jgi:lactate permease
LWRVRRVKLGGIGAVFCTTFRQMRGAPVVGVQRGFPPLLLPTLNSVGAEIGKPIAPQTTSVGVSTSTFVHNGCEVIRYNFGWTLMLLAYLIVIGVVFYFGNPAAIGPH